MGHMLQPIYLYKSFRFKYIKYEGLTLTWKYIWWNDERNFPQASGCRFDACLVHFYVNFLTNYLPTGGPTSHRVIYSTRVILFCNYK